MSFEIENKIRLLQMNFSNSFFKSLNEKYSIVFANSNVVEEMDILDDLATKLFRRKDSNIIKNDINLLTTIIESYTYLIGGYKKLNNVQLLSPKLKRYDMVSYLQDYTKKINADESVEKKIELLLVEVSIIKSAFPTLKPKPKTLPPIERRNKKYNEWLNQ